MTLCHFHPKLMLNSDVLRDMANALRLTVVCSPYIRSNRRAAVACSKSYSVHAENLWDFSCCARHVLLCMHECMQSQGLLTAYMTYQVTSIIA